MRWFNKSFQATTRIKQICSIDRRDSEKHDPPTKTKNQESCRSTAHICRGRLLVCNIKPASHFHHCTHVQNNNREQVNFQCFFSRSTTASAPDFITAQSQSKAWQRVSSSLLFEDNIIGYKVQHFWLPSAVLLSFDLQNIGWAAAFASNLPCSRPSYGNFTSAFSCLLGFCANIMKKSAASLTSRCDTTNTRSTSTF
jgi:hypothetical protein